MTDQGCPFIDYNPLQTRREWGESHGEEFKQGIHELAEIRRNLMLMKNPSIKDNLDELAKIQWETSKDFAPKIMEELEGISRGANLSLTDTVILNNYTDFRDINLPEEGCSTVHVQNKKVTISGQTWDMHSSAKKYVSIIHAPAKDGKPAVLSFSLVGCVGMMGVNTHNLLIGVNNINTNKAKAGVIWPVLIRRVLEENSLDGLRNTLQAAPVTSGHNYLISSREQGEHWEITPTAQERVGFAPKGEEGYCFHTNHCLGNKVIPLEDTISSSSTTHERFNILEKKVPLIKETQDFRSLLTDHEGYPKSICSHFEADKQDPSCTCGGALAELSGDYYHFWRGCPVYDDNYKEYKFKRDGDSFLRL